MRNLLWGIHPTEISQLHTPRRLSARHTSLSVSGRLEILGKIVLARPGHLTTRSPLLRVMEYGEESNPKAGKFRHPEVTMIALKRVFFDGCVYCFIGAVSVVSVVSGATLIWVLTL